MGTAQRGHCGGGVVPVPLPRALGCCLVGCWRLDYFEHQCCLEWLDFYKNIPGFFSKHVILVFLLSYIVLRGQHASSLCLSISVAGLSLLPSPCVSKFCGTLSTSDAPNQERHLAAMLIQKFCSRCPMLLFTYVIIFVMLDEAGQKTSVPWVLLLMSVTQVACFLTVWQTNRQKTELLSELELTYHMVSTSPLSCMIVYCGKNHQKQPLFSSSSLQNKLFLCFLPQVPACYVQRHCLS